MPFAGTWAVHALQAAMETSSCLRNIVLDGYGRVNAHDEDVRCITWPSHRGLDAIASILVGQYTCTAVMQDPDAASARLLCTSNHGQHSSFQCDMSMYVSYSMGPADDKMVCTPLCKLRLFDPNDQHQSFTLTEQASARTYVKRAANWQLEGPASIRIQFAERCHPMLLSDVSFSGELSEQLGLTLARDASQRNTHLIREQHAVDTDGLKLRTRILSTQMCKIAGIISYKNSQLWQIIHADWGRLLKSCIANRMAQTYAGKGQAPDKAFRDQMAKFFGQLWKQYMSQLKHVTSGIWQPHQLNTAHPYFRLQLVLMTWLILQVVNDLLLKLGSQSSKISWVMFTLTYTVGCQCS